MGNWVLFNLFMAILLDSFEIMEEEELKLPNGFPEVFKKHIEHEIPDIKS